MSPMHDIFTRSAAVRANSYDPKTRTFRAIASTGADVNRGSFIERLPLDAIDVASMVGKPLIDSHATNSVTAAVGKILSAERTADGIEVTAQLLDTPDVAPFAARLEAGLIPGVSIGYRGRLGPAVTQRSGLPIRTLSNVQVSELSLTMQPADAGAVIRSANMPQNIQQQQTQPQQTNPTDLAQFQTFCRSYGMQDQEITELHDLGTTLDEVRTMLRQRRLAAMQENVQPVVRVVNPGVSPDQTRSAIVDALESRMTGIAPKNEMARPFMGQRLETVAAARLEAAGQRATGMTPDEVFRRSGIGGMATVSDFPALLASAGNRVLMSAYTAASCPVKMVLARATTLSDFRAGTKLKLSGLGTLSKVSEAGELKASSRGEASESYALDSYGSTFTLSRKALINDDLGAFRDFSQAAGVAAANTESNLLMGVLTSNPKMGEDGKPVFNAARKNLATAALSVDALSAARQAMRQFTALDGTLINSQAKYLLVGSALETDAEKLLASIYAATTDSVNPFSGRLTLLVDPRISDNSWYLFADPAILPCIEYAHLSSAPGPQIAQEDGFEVLGTKYRVFLDTGAGMIDWRGAYLSTGAGA